MIVDFSSENAENTSYLTACQSADADINVIEETSNVESELKKNRDGFCINVFEDETNTRSKNTDQAFDEKDDFSISCGVTTRSSSRPGKRQRTISPQRSLSATPESSKPDGKRLKSSQKGQKRQWESWGAKEKDVFFEAVLEHSKDFDKIHNYLMKRRGDLSSIVKNKDQVRYFYYRTLNKITKYIPEQNDPVEPKKTNYEVRCLICYGELRKKIRSLKEKDGKKLTELIVTGKTTVRHQGRNVNIRAPVCRALKKLTSNIVIDEVEHVPNKILIELVPGDNKTWSFVQGLSQNPRLRTIVSSRKTLYSLITYLSSKWKLDNNSSISLSPSLVKCHRKAVLNKRNDSETVSKTKVSGEDKLLINDNYIEEEQCSPTAAATARLSIDTNKTANEESKNSFDSKEHQTSDDVTPDNNDVMLEKQNTDKILQEKDKVILKKDDVQLEKNHVIAEKEDIHLEKDGRQLEKDNDSVQQNWDLSSSSNVTIADVYRQLHCPHKLSLCYCLSLKENANDLLTVHAIQHLVKLAMAEFRDKIDAKNTNKKDPMSPSLSSLPKPKLVAKETATVNKISKVSKSSSKSVAKLAPKLAPKLVHEPSLVIPAIVPSVINQITPSTSTRTGNHVTFGFTPISSFQTPSPFLPKMKKSRKSRVVVQRTLLPRPITAPAAGLNTKETTELSFVPSISPENLSPQASALSPHQPLKNAKNEAPVKSNGKDAEAGPHLSSTQHSNAGFCVESLLNIALDQDLRDNVSGYDSTVCTEELDSGISGGEARVKTRTKETSSLVEQIEDLHGHKFDHCGVQSNELLYNLKSPEDEYPLKLLSPSHTQHFHPEWLNEESSDFSLSNIFDHMDHSPTKQKPTNVLDTPKKGTDDFKLMESHINEDVPGYSQPEPVFCDMVDESSVDYVKKFRDLAKKMKNDSEVVSPPITTSTVSFKSFLSEAKAKE